MRAWTLGDIITAIEQELDLEDEIFIRREEIVKAVNEGIGEAEAEIHTLGAEDKYFLSKATISLVAGQSIYPLPSDIYANKIRAVLFSTDSRNFYPIERIRDLAWLGINYQSQAPSGYIILNPSAQLGVQFMVMPTPSSSGQQIMLIYLREANKLTDDTDVCDIPVFVNFVIQFAKCKCLEKEGNPNLDAAVQRLGQLRGLMVSTLSDMVPDENNIILTDRRFYDEQS